MATEDRVCLAFHYRETTVGLVGLSAVPDKLAQGDLVNYNVLQVSPSARALASIFRPAWVARRAHWILGVQTDFVRSPFFLGGTLRELRNSM